MAGENRLSKAQHTHLVNRLREAKSKIRNKTYDRSEPKPPEVKRAFSIVRKWEAKDRAKRDRARKSLDRKVRQIEEALHFQTPEKALKLVQKLEAEV